MGEAAESGGGSFDSFSEVVDRFGGSVGDPCVVPVDDGGVPAGQGAAEAAQFRRAVGVAQVVGEFGGVALGELGAVDVVEAAEGFFGVPRQADLQQEVAAGVDLSAAVADHGCLAGIIAAHDVRRGVKAACGCRKLCRIWSGGISVLVDESATTGRSNDLEVTVWLVWWVGGDGWSLVE